MAASGRKTLRLAKSLKLDETAVSEAAGKQGACSGRPVAERDRNFSDLGASARATRDGGVVIEAREVSVQGNVVIVGARAKYECLLDRLLDHEIIEPPLYDAGVWLRALHLRTRHSEGVSRYGDLGFERDAGRLSYGPEMSDEMAWNLRALRDTMLALGTCWPAVRKLCCDDQMPVSRLAMLDGLTALARLRGFL